MRKIDLPLALTIFTLTVFGWMMVSSLGGPASYRINLEDNIDCTAEGVNCNDKFMWKHFWHMVAGFICLGIGMVIPYKFWKRASIILFLGSFLLLLIVLVSPFGTEFNTFARSWINIGPLPAFQPSEFAKISIILYLSTWMCRKTDKIRTFEEGLIPFAALTSIIVVPIIIQPDYGSALVIAIIAASIYFLAGAKISHLITGALIVFLTVTVIIYFSPRLQERVFARFNPPEDCRQDECYQTYQSLIAIGTGGVFGVGYNNSKQKHNWLPEVETDYIFSGTAEELGFIRVIWVVIAYVYIFYRGYIISTKSPDRFTRLTVMGITIAIVSQAFLNISVNLDLAPVTGITLPLMSYGGSSLVTTLFSLGILLNISKNERPEAQSISRRRRIRRSYNPQPRYYR